MSAASVAILAAACPGWFTVTRQSSSHFEGTANVADTVWAAEGVALYVSEFPTPVVNELVPGTKFPARCPERHVQGDRTFCLGLHHLTITDADIANQWWEQLRQFMMFQSVAELTGVWPPAHALDHGDAGKFHERALVIAAELGIEEEYAAARLDEPSWITDPNLRLLGKKGVWLNGRAPCPRSCRTRCMTFGRHRRMMLRRNCDHRALLLELVEAEHRRRIELDRYWDHVRAQGTVCCGRMRVCKLR